MSLDSLKALEGSLDHGLPFANQESRSLHIAPPTPRANSRGQGDTKSQHRTARCPVVFESVAGRKRRLDRDRPGLQWNEPAFIVGERANCR